MLVQISQKIQELVEAETAIVALAESHGEIVHYAAGVGKYANQIVGLKGDAATSGLCGCTFQDKCPVLVEKTDGDIRVRQDYAQLWGITSALAVPLIYQGKLLGAFLAFNRQDGLNFNLENEQKLAEYANSIIDSIHEYVLNQ
jgi:GAF domain-containing protein